MAVIQTSNGWLEFNDASVRRATMEDLHWCPEAYILFYTQVKSSPVPDTFIDMKGPRHVWVEELRGRNSQIRGPSWWCQRVLGVEVRGKEKKKEKKIVGKLDEYSSSPQTNVMSRSCWYAWCQPQCAVTNKMSVWGRSYDGWWSMFCFVLWVYLLNRGFIKP